MPAEASCSRWGPVKHMCAVAFTSLCVASVHCFCSSALPLEAEEAFGKKTCWDNVWKLEAVIKKSNEGRAGGIDKRKILFLLQGVHYYCHVGLNHPSELTLAALVGKNRLAKGLLDILLFKRDILSDWLTVRMDACRLPPDDRQLIQKTMSDFGTFLAATEHDELWVAPLKPSSRAFVDLLEARCANVPLMLLAHVRLPV